MLEITELNDYEQFIELRKEWNSVLAKSENNDLFLTWEWLSTWWKHFGNERELKILLAKDDKKIIAAAPLMCSNYKILGFRLRKLEFLGAEHTDYHNFILTERKGKCLKLFLKHLSKIDWDFLEFRDIPETPECDLYLRKIFGKKLLQNERVSSVCYYIPLCGTNECSQEIDGDMRRNLRRRMRRLKEKYNVTFERQDEVSSVEQGVKTFVELHQKKWFSKGQQGSFGEDPKFKDFIIEVSKLLAENKWLNLSLLKADDTPISAGLCFEYNNVTYYYHPGYDPAYSKFGVGNLLLMHLIEQASQKGMAKFDFLKGAEPYKSTWTAHFRNNLEFGCTQNHLLPVLYDKIIRSEEYNWIKNSNSEYLRKLKSTVRKVFPSLYAALS